MSKHLLRLASLLKSARRDERGQLITMAAGAIVVVIGFTALAVDIGFLTYSKREAQNDADAMALAAVRELAPNGTTTEPERQEAAEDVARDWADKNDVAEAEIQDISFNTSCSGSLPQGAKTVTVRLRRTRSTFFARIFGIDSGDVNVCATARVGQAQGGPGLMPFGVLYNDPNVPSPPDPPFCYYNGNDDFWGTECTTKIFNPGNNEVWAPGNVGLMRLDDPAGNSGNWGWDECDTSDNNSGMSEVRDNIENGSECGYAPEDVIRTKPGGSGNPTCDELGELLDGNTQSPSDVFKDSNGDGTYDVVDTDSPRYALVPVLYVPPGATGAADVTIKMFVPVYITGCVEEGPQNAKKANVTLIPMKTDLFVAGIDFVQGGSSDYTDDWPLYTIKLID